MADKDRCKRERACLGCEDCRLPSEPGKRLALLLSEAFNAFLLREVPRLRTLEHSRIASHVDNLLEQVRATAAKTAWNAAIDHAIAEIVRYRGEQQDVLASRLKELGPEPRELNRARDSGGRDGT